MASPQLENIAKQYPGSRSVYSFTLVLSEAGDQIRLMLFVSAGEEHVHPVRDIVENRKLVLSNVERGRHLHRAGPQHCVLASSNALRMNST